MILKRQIRLRDVLFAVRGSILPSILPQVATMAAVGCLAVILAHHLAPAFLSGLGAVPFTLIGIALSIFMSFRNSACYARWWEARGLWGQLLIESRSFARQVAHLDEATRAPLLLGLCAFATGLAARLRNDDEAKAIAGWRADLDLRAAPSPCDAVLREVGRACAALVAAGRIDEIRLTLLEARLTQLSYVQGGCEKIKTTPLPFAYSLLLHRTALIFCVLLPFALAVPLGWWTPLVTTLVSYTFFGLDALGDELEDPFGYDTNDLPLDAIVRQVERELLAAAGRTDLPRPIQPTRGLLT